MNKLKVIGLITIVLGGMSVTACDSADFTVGICQLVTHDALDAATNGFIDALRAKMEEAGKTISIDLQNASNDTATCMTIANKFVSANYNLILANATPALQACMASTSTIPILGTSITDYTEATGVEVVDGCLGNNISGTSDLAPLDKQAEMVVDLYPNANSIALLYCSAEANSTYQANIVKTKLQSLGKTVNTYTFSDSNELSAVTTNAANNNDVIYVPTDNTVASNAELVHNICSQSNTPVITGDDGTCRGCGLAVLAIDYYKLGQITGDMVASILLEGANIATTRIRYDENPHKKYNPTICDELGISRASMEARGYEPLM